MYLFTHHVELGNSNNRLSSLLKKRFIFTFLFALSIILLNACGGGGGGGGDVGEDGGGGGDGGNTPPDTSLVLKGVAQKGLFTQLTVKGCQTSAHQTMPYQVITPIRVQMLDKPRGTKPRGVAGMLQGLRCLWGF